MKKSVIILFIILSTFSFGCAEQRPISDEQPLGTYRIDYTFTQISNDSVGDDWQTVVTQDDRLLQSGDTITMPTDAILSLTATVTEIDTRSDTATATLDLPLQDGATAATTVTVVENGGTYIHHAAVWEWTCSVTKTA